MARTAVIAGTATATSNRINARAAAQSPQHGERAPVAAAQSELGQIQEQLTALQAQQAEVAALGEPGAMIAQLQQLGKLKESGLLTDEEFSAAKARLIAG
jgi:hypothetical protein